MEYAGKRLEESAGHAKRLLRAVDPALKGIEEVERLLAGKLDTVVGELSNDFS